MLISYHNDKKLKSMMVKEMENHRKQDQLVKGIYGKQNGVWKGCAVGCAIHSINVRLKKEIPTDSHKSYETELGIPEWLARLEDALFENLPEKESQEFPTKLLKAIPVGVNLEPVKWKFCVFILKECIETVKPLKISDSLKKQVLDAINGSIAVNEECIKTDTYNKAAGAAAGAAAWAAGAATGAAWATGAATWAAGAAAGAATGAAGAAAGAAAWAAGAATGAAGAATGAAGAAGAATWAAGAATWAAWAATWAAGRDTARAAAYIKYANELLRLLKECK